MSIPQVPDTFFDLRPAVFKVAFWLYVNFAGQTAVELSQTTIAEGAHVSKGTVSDAMTELARRGFITRTWDPKAGGNRGGYILTIPRFVLLTPPPADA